MSLTYLYYITSDIISQYSFLNMYFKKTKELAITVILIFIS